jgi:hypothetical protein
MDADSLQNFIELATFPMMALDMQGRVTVFNEKAMQVYDFLGGLD